MSGAPDAGAGAAGAAAAADAAEGFALHREVDIALGISSNYTCADFRRVS